MARPQAPQHDTLWPDWSLLGEMPWRGGPITWLMDAFQLVVEPTLKAIGVSFDWHWQKRPGAAEALDKRRAHRRAKQARRKALGLDRPRFRADWKAQPEAEGPTLKQLRALFLPAELAMIGTTVLLLWLTWAAQH